MNDQLKIILRDAETILDNKFTQVTILHGEDHSEIKLNSDKAKHVFLAFKDPAIWEAPLGMNQLELVELMNQVDSTPPEKLDGFIETLNKLVGVLETVIAARKAAIELGNLPDLNIRMINLLTINQRHIRGRVRFFRDKGINLLQNPKFSELRPKNQAHRNEYRNLLKANEVQAKQTEIDLFKRNGEVCKMIEEDTRFVNWYETYTHLIKNRLPAQA